MYKLVVLACVLAVSQAAVIAPGLGLGYAGLPLGYANAGLPLAGAYGAPALTAHGYAAPILRPAPVAANYALPPVREVQEAPIVETAVEPVEQHGYSIRY